MNTVTTPTTSGSPDPSTADGSVYLGLLEHHELVGDDSQWAFGTDFEDPLAGVDTAVPDDVDAADLARYCLMLGDDALVMSHRLGEWCSRAPELEDDIALANIALDLLGQARLLLARAATVDRTVVPTLPAGTPVPAEDALAFFRDAQALRNVRLVEVPNGDFAHTIVRLLVFVTARLAIFARLAGSRDPVLSAIAVKGVKELTYHRDYAARWFRTLAQGTEESHARSVRALVDLWPLRGELTRTHPTEAAVAVAGVGVAPADVAAEVDAVLEHVFAVSGIEAPESAGVADLAGVGGRTGRDGLHTEALSRLLAEMQVVARAHPMGRW